MKKKSDNIIVRLVNLFLYSEPIEIGIGVCSGVLYIIIDLINEQFTLIKWILLITLILMILLTFCSWACRKRFGVFEIRESYLKRKTFSITQNVPSKRKQKDWCPRDIIEENKNDIINYIEANRDKKYHCITHNHFYNDFIEAFGIENVKIKKCYNNTLKDVRKKYSTEKCINCPEKNNCIYPNYDETKVKTFCSVIIKRKP